MRRTKTRRWSRGLSLAELLVGLALGLSLALTLVSFYGGTLRQMRRSDANARLQEEAQIAFMHIARHVRQAGFSLPLQQDGGAGLAANYPATAIALRGCDGGFTDDKAALPDLICVGGSGPDALAYLYEAVAALGNTRLNSSGKSTDCLGSALQSVSSSGAFSPVPTVAGERFFSEGRLLILPANQSSSGEPELQCRGNGVSKQRQPLSEGVEDMQLLFSVAASGEESAPAQILRASEIDDLSSDAGANWARVRSVRCCLLLRAPRGSAAAGQRYRDCAGVWRSASDTRLRRAFSMDIAVRNRLGGDAQ